jgi:RNA-directed DNA polymerase
LAIVVSSPTGEQEVQVGEALEEIIRANGFEINRNKVRLQTRNKRQEVTGLTINRFPNVGRQYVRQIRAMLYAWDEFGLEAAEAEFLYRYDKKYRAPFKEPPSFKRVVKGKIDFLRMVRGKDNPIYLRFLAKYSRLDPDFEYTPPASDFAKPLIITEGKTDWKHLKCALIKLKNAGRFVNLDIEFKEYEDDLDMGGTELKNFCIQSSKLPQNQRLICIFDRDDHNILNSVTKRGEDFKEWGNNVFSFAIPAPDHRQENEDVCIELYYKDSEIKRTDNHGRRLFLSHEFSEKSGRHKEDKTLSYSYPKKISKSRLQIIDAEVFNENDENVALPKSQFAEYVLNQVENFNDFDVSEFEKIFNIVLAIARI